MDMVKEDREAKEVEISASMIDNGGVVLLVM